jgi:hypothetical protein
LSQEYGGDEGWAFIEECCYKLLIDTLLDEVEKSERENCEPGLLTGNDKLKHLIENGPAEVNSLFFSFCINPPLTCSSIKWKFYYCSFVLVP